MDHDTGLRGTANATTVTHTDVDNSREYPQGLGVWVTLLIFLAYVVAQLIGGAAVGCIGGVVFVAVGGDLNNQADLITFTRLITGPVGLAGMVLGGAVSLGLVCWRWRSSIWDCRADGIAVAWGAPRYQALGCVLGLALALGYLGVQVIFPIENVENESMGPMAQLQMSTGVAWVCWVVMALVLAPPIEEFMFRGVLFSGVARAWGRLPAVLISTLLFVLLHIMEIVHDWIGGLAIGMLGLLALLLRVMASALGPAVWMHLTYNLVLVVVVALM